MTLKQNSTPGWVYAIWAVVNVIFAVILDVAYHPGWVPYIVGGIVYGGGLAFMLYEIIDDGDTTLAPYAIQTIGVALFGVIAGSN